MMLDLLQYLVCLVFYLATFTIKPDMYFERPLNIYLCACSHTRCILNIIWTLIHSFERVEETRNSGPALGGPNQKSGFR